MELSEVEKAILIGAVSDLKRLRSTPLADAHRNYNLQVAIKDANEFGHVPSAIERWTGGVAHSMVGPRAIRKLAAKGLLVRVVSSGKTLHVEPTEFGIALVAQLHTEQPAE